MCIISIKIGERIKRGLQNKRMRETRVKEKNLEISINNN